MTKSFIAQIALGQGGLGDVGHLLPEGLHCLEQRLPLLLGVRRIDVVGFKGLESLVTGDW